MITNDNTIVPFKELDTDCFSGYSGDIIKLIWSSKGALILSKKNWPIDVNLLKKTWLLRSVGEDIEARVDYLTQDKARLAADIRQYSNKICKDFEEKEKLSVESYLWKSKFLACR